MAGSTGRWHAQIIRPLRGRSPAQPRAPAGSPGRESARTTEPPGTPPCRTAARSPSGRQGAHAARGHPQAVQRACGTRSPACTAHQQRTIQGHRRPQARARCLTQARPADAPVSRPPQSALPLAAPHRPGPVVAVLVAVHYRPGDTGRVRAPGHGLPRTRPNRQAANF